MGLQLHSYCQIFSCIVLLSPHADVWAAEGSWGANDVEFDVDSDDCPALSLIQRKAHLTSTEHSKSSDVKTLKVDAGEGVGPGALKGKANGVARTPHWKEALLTLESKISTFVKTKDLSNATSWFSIFLIMFGLIMAIVRLIIPEEMPKFIPLTVSMAAAAAAACPDDVTSSEASTSVPEASSGYPSAASRARAASMPCPVAAADAASAARSASYPSSANASLSKSTDLMQATQMLKSPSRLLFPTMAADVRRRNSFDVFWGTTASPWFRLDVKPGLTDSDKLELYEVHEDARLASGSLCAAVELNSTVGKVDDGTKHWRVTNHYLQANTRGLAYRSGQDNSKVRNAVASWGTTVPGQDMGDGWLKVGDWYLPMKVDGQDTIIPADETPQISGLQVTRGDGMSFATLKLIAGGQWAVLGHGGTQPLYNLSIGTNGFLLEARLPNGKPVACVKRDQVKMDNEEMMLELVVEPGSDPVIMLICSCAVLRQLPAHPE